MVFLLVPDRHSRNFIIVFMYDLGYGGAPCTKPIFGVCLYKTIARWHCGDVALLVPPSSTQTTTLNKDIVVFLVAACYRPLPATFLAHIRVVASTNCTIPSVHLGT
jgi:hypothetical protein